jgi:hypothetical protein
MTRLFRGEIIKAATTRTAYAYMAVGVVLAIATVPPPRRRSPPEAGAGS